MSDWPGRKCDRCGAIDASKKHPIDGTPAMPAGWGYALLKRGTPFCNSGELDLCPSCWTEVYNFTRRPPEHTPSPFGVKPKKGWCEHKNKEEVYGGAENTTQGTIVCKDCGAVNV